MSGYWAKRQQEIQAAIADKTIAQTEKQLAKYYKDAMLKVIEDFEATYDKILASKAKDEQVTPADLYKLDRYWQMQSQLKQELQKLGEMEIALLSDAFEKEWEDVYEATSIPSDVEFATVSTQGARALIDAVWLADGKNFSQRIWGNTEYLAQTLNEQLTHCIVTGKKTTELRDLLVKRFNVSLNQANTLIRTEAAHIQIEAAKQRYQDYGMEKYEFFADTDDRTCTHNSKAKSCKELDGKVFLLSEMKPGVNAPPMHPRCRCSVLAVLPSEREKEMDDKAKIQDKKPISAERKKELKDLAGKIANNDRSELGGYRWTPASKALFLQQLEDTSRKKINKGEKREIREMVADYDDSMFKKCTECGRVFIKDNPKSNRAIRCPECQAEERKRQKAEAKRKAAEKKREQKKQEKRRKYKADWAKAYRQRKKTDAAK